MFMNQKRQYKIFIKAILHKGKVVQLGLPGNDLYLGKVTTVMNFINYRFTRVKYFVFRLC